MTTESDPSSAWQQRLEADADILAAAGSQEEWNDVLAEILQFWICAGRAGLLRNNLRAKLTEAVRVGFAGDKKGRPRAKLMARSDANLILRNMSDRPFVTINGQAQSRVAIKDMADAARCIAEVERVSLEAARKRAERACTAAGIDLPPGKVFGKNPSPRSGKKRRI
jgi:hypothetical protein